MRIDSWDSQSPELEIVEKPSSPKRTRIDPHPGPLVTRQMGRSRTLSSSSTFSMADSHGSAPSVDSGYGRGFDVSQNHTTTPAGMQVCVLLVGLICSLLFLCVFVFFVFFVCCSCVFLMCFCFCF